jgi:hypothetical protein
MVGDFSEHRSNDADIVRASAHVGKELGDLEATLAVALEFEGRLHESASLALVAEVAAGHGLTMVFLEHRLVVEAIDVREAAVHEKKDDVLCLGLEVGVAEHPGVCGGGIGRGGAGVG